MGKKQRTQRATGKHIKTRHKKSTVNRKVAHQKVDRTLVDINHIISKQASQHIKTNKEKVAKGQQKIQLETISAEDMRRLLNGGKQTKPKAKTPKLSLDDSAYLQNLLKKWGTNYDSMSKDIRLNRMQWTAKQIQKKHQAYKTLLGG